MSEETRVFIVGIRGEMGDWFRRYFEALPGCVVRGARSGVPTAIRYAHEDSGGYVPTDQPIEQAVRESELVLFSGPLLSTPDLIRSYAPWSSPDQLWCDIASIKAPLFEARAYAGVRGEVLTFHPLFAGLPKAGPVSFDGRIVIVCDEVGPRGRALVERFRANGARLVETTRRHHDRMMAVVQGLTHLNAVALGLALRKLDMTAPETEQFTTPLYRLVNAISKRVLSGNGELYAGIQVANRANLDVLQAYADALGDLLRALHDGSPEEACRRFRECFDDAAQASLDHDPQFNAEEIHRITRMLDHSE